MDRTMRVRVYGRGAQYPHCGWLNVTRITSEKLSDSAYSTHLIHHLYGMINGREILLGYIGFGVDWRAE